ncbi:coiled-coil domain-containing protein 17 isoform X4 [Pogoniulus pusillus]|uniref:coiled-coil domain-containing protein 17 isoform X4 n=1 Tax=Pogoniulus pusillus TaxID=488313 RepID=UPI0030B948A3
MHRAALRLDNILPVTGPLAAEARFWGCGRALRLSYLRGGGHDPDILDRLLQLQIEAMELENGPTRLRRGKRMEPPGTGMRGLDAALLAVELENRRLEDEVLALKVRRERRVDAGHCIRHIPTSPLKGKSDKAVIAQPWEPAKPTPMWKAMCYMFNKHASACGFLFLYISPALPPPQASQA